MPDKKQKVDAITTDRIAVFSFLYKAGATKRQICWNKNGEAAIVPQVRATLKIKYMASVGAVKIMLGTGSLR